MNVTVNYEEGAVELARQLFGRGVSDEELAAAAGALDGAVVDVSVRMNGRELHVEITHPLIAEQRRGFRLNENGDLCIWNHRFDKHIGAPKGVGLASFIRQVSGARQLGVKQIELYAAGNSQDVRDIGYFVWAIFGFDAPLTEREKWLLTPELAGAQTVNEVINRGGHAGQQWWRDTGDSRKMIFDLDDRSSIRSSMMSVFKNYLRRKGLINE